MILFDLQFRFIVVVLTMVFRRGIIFASTTIPVHVLLLPYPNNNNTVMYVHVPTDSDINNDVHVHTDNGINNDADTCIFNGE